MPPCVRGSPPHVTDHVYKSIEITGSSPDGTDQAIRNALSKAAESVRNIDWFEVAETRGVMAEGGTSVGYFQVTLKIGFRLE
jgi:flavin-binding protein dodecin